MAERSKACDRESAEQYFEWLDQLRADGHVNMFGARPLLCQEFGLDGELGGAVLSAWQKTYQPGQSAAERAARAFAE